MKQSVEVRKEVGSAMSHFVPVQPVLHTQVDAAALHTPLMQRRTVYTGVEQSAPDHPGRHRHTPAAKSP